MKIQGRNEWIRLWLVVHTVENNPIDIKQASKDYLGMLTRMCSKFLDKEKEKS